MEKAIKNGAKKEKNKKYLENEIFCLQNVGK